MILNHLLRSPPSLYRRPAPLSSCRHVQRLCSSPPSRSWLIRPNFKSLNQNWGRALLSRFPTRKCRLQLPWMIYGIVLSPVCSFGCGETAPFHHNSCRPGSLRISIQKSKSQNLWFRGHSSLTHIFPFRRRRGCRRVDGCAISVPALVRRCDEDDTTTAAIRHRLSLRPISLCRRGFEPRRGFLGLKVAAPYLLSAADFWGLKVLPAVVVRGGCYYC